MSNWTDERVEKLKELWAGGASASQMALAIGDISRNAVIGKGHRIGLPKHGLDVAGTKHGTGGGPKKKPRMLIFPGNKGSVPKLRTPPVKFGEDAKAPEPIGAIEGFPDRDRITCRSIIGEIGKPGWRLCGHPGWPWCSHHKAKYLVRSQDHGKPKE